MHRSGKRLAAKERNRYKSVSKQQYSPSPERPCASDAREHGHAQVQERVA